jgi:hypothetical protein
MKCIPEGQQASSGRSATLVLLEHQRLEKRNIVVLRRRIGGRWWRPQQVLHGRWHGISLCTFVCDLPHASG